MLGIVNKLWVFIKLLTTPSNVLPLYLKLTFPRIIWIFIEGEDDRIKSGLPFKIFSTLQYEKFNFHIWCNKMGYLIIYNLIQTSFLALRLFYGGYGCLEKNGGKENNLRQMRHPQIEDVLGQLSLSDSFFFLTPVFFDVIWMLTIS